MTIFKLSMAATAVWAVMMIAVGERDPPKPPAAVADAILDRWPDDPPAAPKADRLPLAAAAEVFPAEVVAPVAAARTDVHQTVGAIASVRRHTTERNVCTRHGMHKQITRGGRSWRCRR
jgi:hypothetical protein